MPFSKTFPKTIPGSNYPVWEEVYLTQQEEHDVEEQCRRENYQLLDLCLQQAKALAIKHSINEDSIRATLAVALFEKQASHVIFHKENRAKEKWDEMNHN